MTEELGPVGPKGVAGFYGPNDDGYINQSIRMAAEILVRASGLWARGYGYKCERMSPEHPIARALAALADGDKATACFANKDHEPRLFEPVRPSDEEIAAFNRR